jgi:hypothetical protein
MQRKHFIRVPLFENPGDFAILCGNRAEFEIAAIVTTADSKNWDYDLAIDGHLEIEGLTDLHRLRRKYFHRPLRSYLNLCDFILALSSTRESNKKGEEECPESQHLVSSMPPYFGVSGKRKPGYFEFPSSERSLGIQGDKVS